MTLRTRMPEAASRKLLVTMLVLSLAVAGCGRSQQGAQLQADNPGLCTAIMHTGLAIQCAASGSDGTVHVTIANDDDQAARNICAGIAGRIAQQDVRLPARWMLQVYSPYRSDKPLAVCPLH